MDHIIGQLLAIVTALCWAQNSLIYAHVGAQVSSNTTAHIRLWIALPLMLLVHLVLEGTIIPIGMTARAYVFIGISGALGFCVADLFIFSSFVHIGARQTMVIMTTSPLFSALLARVFGSQILSPLQITGMVVTLTGVAWVVYADRGAGISGNRRYVWTGIAIALGGAITQAISYVLAESGMTDDIPAVSANVVRLVFGLLSLIIFASVRGSFFEDFRRFTGKAGHRALRLVIAAAIVGPVLGIILNLQALKMAPVGVVTTLSQLTPVMLLPLERFILKRHVSAGAVAGTFVAVFGSVLLFI
jgi:drug/metabolite transporter (DMT)-like permease